jgi:drug/metabolite transporter (DMT)-like permease
MVFVVACWGLVFVGIAEVLPYLDSLQLVTIRFIMISAVFGAIFLLVPRLRPRFRSKRDVALFAVAGLFGVPGSQLPTVHGQNYLSPPLVALIVTSAPAWVAALSAVILKERVSKLQALGFVIAVTGTSVIVLTGAGSSRLSVDNPWGAAVTLLNPVCWATYTLIARRFTRDYAIVTAVGTSMIAGSIWLIPLLPHSLGSIGDIPPSAWAWLTFLTLGGTVVPYMIWSRSLSVLTATTTTAYMYVIPLAALLWSWFILGLHPTVLALTGGLVVITGVSVIQVGQRRSQSSVPN